MSKLSDVLSTVVKQASFFSETVRDDALKAVAEFDKDFADNKVKVNAIWDYLKNATPLPTLNDSSTPPATFTPVVTTAPSAVPSNETMTMTTTTPDGLTVQRPGTITDADVAQGNSPTSAAATPSETPSSAAETTPVESSSATELSDALDSVAAHAATGDSVTPELGQSVVSATPVAASDLTEAELEEAIKLFREARSTK
jgi:hypothetical protein